MIDLSVRHFGDATAKPSRYPDLGDIESRANWGKAFEAADDCGTYQTNQCERDAMRIAP